MLGMGGWHLHLAQLVLELMHAAGRLCDCEAGLLLQHLGRMEGSSCHEPGDTPS